MSVLFVDGSADERALFAERFGADGARLTIVASADDALDVLSRGETELLVAEVHCSATDGFELVRRMRELATARSGVVPAIAVMTRSPTADVEHLLRRSFAGYVVKPYTVSDLFAAVADASTAIAALRRLRVRDQQRSVTQYELRTRLSVDRRHPRVE